MTARKPRGPYTYDFVLRGAKCARCKEFFLAIKRTKPFLYCPPCNKLEKREAAKLGGEKLRARRRKLVPFAGKENFAAR